MVPKNSEAEIFISQVQHFLLKQANVTRTIQTKVMNWTKENLKYLSTMIASQRRTGTDYQNTNHMAKHTLQNKILILILQHTFNHTYGHSTRALRKR